MSEEKLYAVKNDDGYYWEFGDLDGFWQLNSVSCPITVSEDNAKYTVKEHGGHVVELVEKPKRYVLPMPGTDYHNNQMHGNAQYYAVKGTGNWRSDAIALGTDDAVKHGYTVTQSDIDAAPDWVKTITPVEVTDDEQ